MGGILNAATSSLGEGEKLEHTHATVVWFIGEAYAGTVLFSRENLIGIYKELKDRLTNQDGRAPDAIVFGGELLPKIPEYITRGGTSKARVLQEGMEDLGLAEVAIKPHLKRITELIANKSRKTKLVYITSSSDQYNKQTIHDDIVKIYSHAPGELTGRIKSYIDKIESNGKIIDNSRKALDKLQAEKENASISGYESKIKNINEKISQLEETNGDYRKILHRYEELLSLWLKEHNEIPLLEVHELFNPEKDPIIDELIKQLSQDNGKSLDELKREYDQISKQLEKTSIKKEPKKFEELNEKSKWLADLIKKYSGRALTEAEKEAKQRIHKRIRVGELFTHNLAGGKNLDEIAWKIAETEIETHIRNAFGRRTNIEIINEKVADITVKKEKIRVSNNPTNISEQYKINVYKDLKKEVHINIGEGKGADTSTPILVVMFHSNIYTMVVEPQSNESEKISYTVAVPPIISQANAIAAWNQGIKTPLTAVYDKGQGITSGFVEAVMKGNKVTVDFKTEYYLRKKAEEEFEQQRPILDKHIQLQNDQSNGTELDIEDRLQIENKLPSEMNQRLLKEVVRKPEALDWIKQKYELGEIHTLPIMQVNDTHIGTSGYGIPTLYLLDGLEEYIKDKGLKDYLLVFGGDNIEGNYKGILNETNSESMPTNLEDFERFLKEKGYSDRRVRDLTEKYAYYLSLKQPIQNPDLQIKRLEEHTKQLRENAAAIIYVSGQHFNKSYEDRSRDEATALAQISKQDAHNIVVVPGGDKGAREIEIATHGASLKAFVAHNPITKNMQFDKNTLLILGADKHVHEAQALTFLNGGFVFVARGTTSSLTTSYPNEKGIMVSESTRGFSLAEISFSYSNKGQVIPLEMETMLINKDMLRKYMPQIPKEVKAFEEALRKAEPNKVKN